ncbi:MAG: cytochrome c-type biogenesis protein CcmH [Bradyrhizobiaceae bacterium]|nr:cytochrome c-type biogenesis protein CcmH [Bradyrhizobiaceae bacterium]
MRRPLHGIALHVAALAFAFATALGAALALEPGEMLKDSALEARARALTKTLRCMVCQNESIDDSNAPLARDLRVLVRERVAAGDSDAQVREFLVARYGEFILLEPRFGARTLLLWGVPVLVIVLGGLGVALAIRAKRPAPAPLSEEEQRRLAAILNENKKL